LENFSHGSQNFLWQLPDGIYFWGQKSNITPVRPIPSLIRKQKSLTWKHLSRIGRTKFSYVQPWNHGRRQSDGNFFFRKNRFFSDKKSLFVLKIDKKKIWKSRNQYFILTPFIGSKKSLHIIIYFMRIPVVINDNTFNASVKNTIECITWWLVCFMFYLYFSSFFQFSKIYFI
jgi:hypothetical protein